MRSGSRCLKIDNMKNFSAPKIDRNYGYNSEFFLPITIMTAIHVGMNAGKVGQSLKTDFFLQVDRKLPATMTAQRNKSFHAICGHIEHRTKVHSWILRASILCTSILISPSPLAQGYKIKLWQETERKNYTTERKEKFLRFNPHRSTNKWNFVEIRIDRRRITTVKMARSVKVRLWECLQEHVWLDSSEKCEWKWESFNLYEKVWSNKNNY